ncbi:MAG: NAD(P)/FAD-dependent oxidoreductase [Candidatus Berkelbacteria bacterium]|nr:NAD(P)/FAD-dependent oxidoreductase [Candidatus Berkelbacteria bacterium]
MKKYDIAIIGAGPAGILAAIMAVEAGANIALFDKNDQIGRKILATGNGRCNLTNKDVDSRNFHGANAKFIQRILDQFTNIETMQFFESLGLLLKEEDRGRIFPRSNQAKSVVEVLGNKLDELNADIFTNKLVKRISKDESDFLIEFESGETFRTRKLILSTGGKAAFQFGSSGDGLFWSKLFGHNIVPIKAALVPVETIEIWPSEVQGLKLEVKVSIKQAGNIIATRSGDLLFTHFGVSGPAVMGLARDIAYSLEKGDVNIEIDIFPEIDSSVLDKKIAETIARNGQKSVKNSLIGFAPLNLLPILLGIANVDGERKAAEISKADRISIVKAFKSLDLRVKSVRPLKEAQVSAGGIDVREIDENTLESKLVPGLFFAGEIIDVDGDSGGFNLQWAWSSGFVAGKSAAKMLKNM